MPHKTKQSALKAARKALGDTAVEGVDFVLRNTGAGWVHEEVPAANEAAAKSKARKSPKGKKAARVAEAPVPPVMGRPERSTRTEQVMGMLRGGATSKEMEAATGWKPHSVRGLIGALKKQGLDITSTKVKGSPVVYRLGVGDVI